MMTTRTFAAALAAGISLFALAGCSNDPTLAGTNTGTFIQIDREGRPAINMIFVPFAQHLTNDKNAPSKDLQVIGPEITTFMTQTAGRSASTASAAQSLLLGNSADVLIADFSQMGGGAGYLGVETSGKIGMAFGGRALGDNVMDTTLGIAFGNTLGTIGLTSDDGKENNGLNSTPNLTTDYVSAPATPPPVFPYLAAPQ